jgi:hypothetical protein
MTDRRSPPRLSEAPIIHCGLHQVMSGYVTIQGWVTSRQGANGKPPLDRYWSRAGYVWNNGGDTAALRSSSGEIIDTYKYRKANGTTYC